MLGHNHRRLTMAYNFKNIKGETKLNKYCKEKSSAALKFFCCRLENIDGFVYRYTISYKYNNIFDKFLPIYLGIKITVAK